MDRPYLAVCPVAPAFHLRRGPVLPPLEAHGPPYATWFRGSHWDQAVFAGTDARGERLSVVRGYNNDLLLPMSTSQQAPPAIGAWGGQLIETYQFETLVIGRGRAEWVSARDGDVPAQAFPICETIHGETAYSARARVGGHLVLGRLIPSEGACVGILDGKVVAAKDYEVLCIM